MYQESKSKTKLPDRKMMLRELPLVKNHNPFGSIKAYQIVFIEPAFEASKDTWLRFMEFKWRCIILGFWYTRRYLNIKHNKNFQKLYGDFYDRLPLCNRDLNNMYQEGIDQFFNPIKSSWVDDEHSEESRVPVKQVCGLVIEQSEMPMKPAMQVDTMGDNNSNTWSSL